MLESTLVWAIIVAFLAVVVVRKAVIIVKQGYEYTVDDSTWKVKGPDLPAGTHIKVADVEGTVFMVESAE